MNTHRNIYPALLIGAAMLLLAGNAIAKKDKGTTAPDEWYMKTMLSVTDPLSGTVISDSRSGVFGQLAASETGYDRHDLPAYKRTGNSKAAIVFIQGENWGDQAGEYLSDYRPAGVEKTDWQFTVNSSLYAHDVTLHWDGLFLLTKSKQNGATRYSEEQTLDHDVLKDLHLVDLKTGVVTKAVTRGKGKKNGTSRLNSYTFSMFEETSRQFRWVLGNVTDEHLLPGTESAVLSKLQEQQLEAADAIENHGKKPAKVK